MILLFGDRANSHKTSSTRKNTNQHPVENSGILAFNYNNMAEARQALTIGQFDEYVSENSAANYEAAVLAFASSGIFTDSESTDAGFCGVSAFFAACGDCGFSGGESFSSAGSSCGGYTSVA